MSEMGGVTVQQIMRRKFDVIIRHTAHCGGYSADVVKGGIIISRHPDDCLASASYLLTKKVWEVLRVGNVRYAYSQCYTYLQGKDINNAVGQWNRQQFESDLLPKLMREGNLSHQIAEYDRVKGMQDECQVYELYDVLVRLYMYAREHNIVIQREGIEGYQVIQHAEGFVNISAECIDVTEAADALVYLKMVHPSAVEKEVGGRKYLLKEKPVSTYRSARGEAHNFLSEAALKDLMCTEMPRAVVSVVPHRAEVDSVVRNSCIDMVGRILGQDGKPMCEEERELLGFASHVVSQRKMGKHALVGLGNVAGEGELKLCLDKVFYEVIKKNTMGMSPDECYKLAASKLSGMNSAKILVREDGVLQIRNRVSSG